jgi:hypothetical protein
MLAGQQVDQAAGGGLVVGPVSWIDKPHNGASFPMQPIEVISHSNDPGGVTMVEMSANGSVFTSLPVSGPMALAEFTWNPSEAGNYVLRVRAQNGSGIWGEYTEANIQVGVPTITPTPTATLTSTPQIVTVTPTPTPEGDGKLSFSASASTNQIFYGGCAPGQVTITGVVSDPAAVDELLLFTRLQDQQTGAMTEWDGGSTMTPSGGGVYTITMGSDGIANSNAYSDAWLIYQLVAVDTNEVVIGRSPRIADVGFSKCGSAPAQPPKIITVSPTPNIFKPILPPPS